VSHARVFEHDGAFKCFSCNQMWGAVPGKPIEPPTCEGKPHVVCGCLERDRVASAINENCPIHLWSENAALRARLEKAEAVCRAIQNNGPAIAAGNMRAVEIWGALEAWKASREAKP